MGDFLRRMAKASTERAGAARAAETEAALAARADAMPPALPLRLARFDVIAELKRRSPAVGGLTGAAFDPAPQLAAYAAGGAVAVSVLTEPDEFHGSLDDLRAAAEQLAPLQCPVMRKDFLVDSYQVLEARANGASGVLLIAAMLSDAALEEMTACAQSLGLFVLLEAFDGDDLERIAKLEFRSQRSQILVGVNSRDLRTLTVDFDRFADLAGQIREDLPAVAESGLGGASDIATVARLGYSVALVGSSLMRNRNAEAAVARLISTGRSAARERALCS